MVSKSILFLGLSLAIVLIISSEVAARDLDQTSTKSAEKTGEANGVNDAKYGGGYQGGGGYPGGGGYGGGGYGRGGGYCRHGCCYRGYHGGSCKKCCSYAGEAVDAGSHN